MKMEVFQLRAEALPPTLHFSFLFTISHIESSSTGSSFPAVFAWSVPHAAGSLKRR